MGHASRRLHLFEFGDLPWLPELLRQAITDVLFAMHRVFRTHGAWAPKVARLLDGDARPHLVDLGSGGGGPAIRLVQELEDRYGIVADLTLTDRYPNRGAVERVRALGRPNITYRENPVDATNDKAV